MKKLLFSFAIIIVTLAITFNPVSAQTSGGGGSGNGDYVLADTNSVIIGNATVTPGYWDIPITIQSSEPIFGMKIVVKMPKKYVNYAYFYFSNWDYDGWPERNSFYDYESGNVTFALANAYSFGGVINAYLRLSINASDSITQFPITVTTASFNDTIKVMKLVSGVITVYGKLNFGDVDNNGMVGTMDASKILKVLVGKDVLKTVLDTLRANVSGSRMISACDANLILQRVTDSNFYFPVQDFNSSKGVAMKTPISVIAVPSGDGVDIKVDPAEEAIKYGDLSIELPQGVTVSSSNFGGEKNQIGSTHKISFASELSRGVIHLSGKNALQAKITGKLDGRTIRIKVINPMVVNNNTITPQEFMLAQNYPNPFNPTTMIGYTLPAAGPVTLKVYDMLGKEVAVLVNEQKSTGEHSVEFNAKDLTSGIYFYTIQAGNFTQTKKLVLMK